MLLCILLIPYAESLAPPNSSCAVRIYMLDFLWIIQENSTNSHTKREKAAEPKLAQLGNFPMDFLAHGVDFLAT